MVTKVDVIDLHIANPDWTAKQLSNALGCTQVYINNCRKNYGLDIPREVARKGQSMAALGRAAFAAGLTVEKIESMRGK